MEDHQSRFINLELSSSLQVIEAGKLGGEKQYVLRRRDGQSWLPGQPWVKLGSGTELEYFRREFLAPELDRMVPYLWLIATPSAINVTPLHHQTARSREVLVTEHPGLHGVWYRDKIFIKPIPPYLLCGDFWEYIRRTDEAVFKSAAGFMRTYCHLIQYETDFRKAIGPELQLIPAIDGEAPTFDRFVAFMEQFQDLPDSALSPRYSYGFLRLSRLNYMALLVLGKLTYFHVYPRWKDYLSRFVAPFITLFAILATILNCMQVALAAKSLQPPESLDGDWPRFIDFCLWFPVAVIILITMLLIAMCTFLAVMVIKTRIAARRTLALMGKGFLNRKHVSITMHGNKQVNP
ncbi:hypothetical protein GQ53DRAFT_733998 [Thozetella sp. PMI_491]|nr:hypothetical protein GQ53DRAFT_733998 [Thozetella sp. PMI_491]